jgi:lipoprotein-anchoring transpeptidase ErfK/SrfK
VITAPQTGVTVDTRAISRAIAAELRAGGHSAIPLPVSHPKTSKAPAQAQRTVVVRLSTQTLTAYLDGKPVLQTPVTTGRPALPTPVGSFYVHFRASPYTFISPWPPGSPYYYPPAPVTWAMYFYDNDFLHDDPAEPEGDYGAGSQDGPYASHGCVHVPHDAMAFLYDWLPVGAPVIVSQT